MSQYVPCYNHSLDQIRVLPGKEEMAPPHTQYGGALIGERCVDTPSTYQSSITLPSMLSHEDEKQSVRRVCKNVSVRTLLQSFAVLPGKEEMAPLTGRADLCYVDGWGALIGEHCVERCLDVCTPSTHQSSITLPSIQDNAFS